MGWGSEFFVPKTEVSGTGKEAERKEHKTEKLRHCASCNQIIGVVSTTIYEIDEKHYCSECYSQKIVATAAERDHSDIKLKKEPQK